MDKQPVSEVFTIRLPLELRDALDHAAAADHRTTAALIRKILTEWLHKYPMTQKGPRTMKKLAIALVAALALQALPAAAQVLTPNDNWRQFDPRYSTPSFSNNTVRTPHGSYNCRVYNNGLTECW